MPRNQILGKHVNIREVEIEDASFILSLRCDEKKSQFLHKTENDLQKQQDYIRRYKTLTDEWYFIIEDKNGAPIGTYRIYNLKADSFCIGSWLMTEGVSFEKMLEGEYLCKQFAFKKTGFTKFHFDVRKENKKVIRFHQLMGAKIVGENELDYFFECTKEDYLKCISRFISY